MSFADRIGGVLVAPRRTLGAVAAGEGGLRDVTLLLLLRLVAGETVQLAKGIAAMPSLGFAEGAREMLRAAMAILPDAIGMLIGAVVMALFAGRHAKGRELDVASYAWVPYLAVQLAASLVETALGWRAHAFDVAVAVVAVGWAALVWGIGLRALRRVVPA